jgi:hypothetical protein
MGIFGFATTVCILSLITLQGLNSTAALEAQKHATALVAHVGQQFKVDAKHLKLVVENLPYLKFVALGAFAVFVVRFYAFFLALYVILTQAEPILQRIPIIQKAIVGKGPVDGANEVYSELTYILTNVAIITYLLSICWSSSRSSKSSQKGTHTVHK